MAMTTRKAIAIGLVLGIVVEILVVVTSLASTNLFHGGHLGPVAKVLLPGLGMAERLPWGTPGYVFGVLLVASLLQFPLYGALAGRDYARRRLSRTAKLVIAMHALGVGAAFLIALMAGHG